MANDGFLTCTNALPDLSAEELKSLHSLVGMAIQAKGFFVATAAPTIDLGDLTKKAMQLLQSQAELTGWEMALLAGVIVQFGGFSPSGAEEPGIESRAITAELRRYAPRSIANITSVTDTLRERRFIDESEISREKGAHRTFRISFYGQQEVLKIWSRWEKAVTA